MQVGLIAPQNAFLQVAHRLTAILYARIVPLELYHTGKFKVLDHSSLPNEKSVPLGGVVLCRFPYDRTLFNLPKLFLSHPSAEVLAIEEAFEFLSGQGDQSECQKRKTSDERSVWS